MADQAVHKLVELAEQKTDQSRRRLFDSMTDLFIEDDARLSEHERAVMSDILIKLVDQVEADIRKELAQRLLDTNAELPEVVSYLANEDIEIARPLLEESKVLRDADLIEVIRMRTDEHRMVIAMRENVSEEVADSLVEYGSQDVIEALLKNSDAGVSQRSMEYLVSESRRIDRFQEPLLTRSDLPPELAYRMYWWVSAALRKKIVKDFEVDIEIVDDALQQATRTAIVSNDEQDGAVVRAERLVRRMEELGDLTIQFLVRALRQQKVLVFVAGLAVKAGIDFNTAWRVFNDKGGESFAILAKAIKIDRNMFTSIFLLVGEARDKTGARSTGDLAPILELYNVIEEEQAKGVLRYWQRDAAYQLALDDLQNV